MCGQTDKQRNRETDKQTNRQTDKQTNYQNLFGVVKTSRSAAARAAPRGNNIKNIRFAKDNPNTEKCPIGHFSVLV